MIQNNENVHIHICEVCKISWSHDPDKIQWNSKAHECPKCGESNYSGKWLRELEPGFIVDFELYHGEGYFEGEPPSNFISTYVDPKEEMPHRVCFVHGHLADNFPGSNVSRCTRCDKWILTN
jgi:hypothetical protein